MTVPEIEKVFKKHPAPWHWRDTYNFREHLEHRDRIFEVNCPNRTHGRIQLVDANGEVVLQEWADHAGDAGLRIDEDVAKLIVLAVNCLALED
jgi:hypothetical protein